MNPAIMAAIVASQKKSEHSADDLVAKLRERKALSSSSAVAMPDYDEAKVDEAVGLGLVKRSASGRLHVNERAASDRSQSHGWILLVSLLVLGSIAASLIALANS